MQEYKSDQLLRTIQGDFDTLSALQMAKEATHRVIGTLPERGSVVVINGLEFIVKSFSKKAGTLNLEIRKPKKNNR